MDSAPTWNPMLPPCSVYMAGAPHAPSNDLPVRQSIAPRPKLPPTPSATFIIDGMTITHSALSSRSRGMLSSTPRISSITTPQVSRRLCSLFCAPRAATLNTTQHATRNRNICTPSSPLRPRRRTGAARDRWDGPNAILGVAGPRCLCGCEHRGRGRTAFTFRSDRGQHRPGKSVRARPCARALSGDALGGVRPRVGGHRAMDAAGASARRKSVPASTRCRPHQLAGRAAVHADQTPCGALVERGVDMALAGDREGAEQALIAATRLCPDDRGLVAELAGLRFSQSRWSEAQDLALLRVRLAPEDAYAWQLVATSRYPDGRRDGGARRLEPHGRAAHRHDRHSRRRADATTGRRSSRGTAAPTGADARGVRAGAAPAARAAGRLERADEVRTHRWRARQGRRLHRRAQGGAAAGGVRSRRIGARALLLHETASRRGRTLGAGELGTAAWRWAAGGRAWRSAWRFHPLSGFPASSRSTACGSGSHTTRRRRQGGATAGARRASTRRTAPCRLVDQLAPMAGRRRPSTTCANTATSMRRGVGARDYLAAGEHARRASGRRPPGPGGDCRLVGAVRRRRSIRRRADCWRHGVRPTTPDGPILVRGDRDRRSPAVPAPFALWHGAGTGHGRSGLLRAHPLHAGGVLTGPVFGREWRMARLNTRGP